jgi:hypothetical protein
MDFYKGPRFFSPVWPDFLEKRLATLAEANLESKQCVVFLTIVVPWRKG